jgi:hypothetical protein
MKRVVLHIDRLLLRGFARSDVAAVSAGMRSELQSLLSDDAAVAALSRHQASHVLQSGTVRVMHGGSAAAVGHAVAGRIVRGAKS